MVEIKLCLRRSNGTIEYRRMTIPLTDPSIDLLKVLKEKLLQLYPDEDHSHSLIQYEGEHLFLKDLIE